MTRTFLSAEEASRELSISKTTLYAYVSRGLIRSESDQKTRQRRYRVEDIEALKTKKMLRKSPKKVLESSLFWGEPILETHISLIDDHQLFYRSRNAIELSRQWSLEKVAYWVWNKSESPVKKSSRLNFSESLYSLLSSISSDLTIIETFQALLPIFASQDLAAHDLSVDGLINTGIEILNLMTMIATRTLSIEDSIATHLTRHWLDNDAYKPLIESALILCADHELNISTFTARCVASSGANLYEVVQAGLAALKGPKHGGYCEKIEALFAECSHRDKPIHEIIKKRIKRGEDIPGMRHRLYPKGDPRGEEMFLKFNHHCSEHPELKQAIEIIETVQKTGHYFPTIDFALVTLSRILKLPEGAPIAIFAIGRAIGWIGHAIEQYQDPRIIRPRSRYIGE